MISALPATRPLPLTPARRAILAVGVPAAAALIGWAGFTIVAAVGTGSYPVHDTIPLPDDHLTMSLDGGNLTLQGGAATGVARLTGTVYYSLVRPDVHLDGDQSAGASHIAFGCAVSIGNCGLNATVDVPASTAVTISTGGGNLSATNLTSNISLSTGGGNLTATAITGDASLHTGGGDLDAAQLTGDVDFSTGGGNITATIIDARQATANSGGGDIEIVFTRVPQNVQVGTDGGDVTIVVPPGTASYDVTTSLGGGNLTDSVPQNSLSPNKITASSGGGDITIEQSSR